MLPELGLWVALRRDKYSQEGPRPFQKGLSSGETAGKSRERGTDSCRAQVIQKWGGPQQEGLSGFTWGKMRKREETG